MKTVIDAVMEEHPNLHRDEVIIRFCPCDYDYNGNCSIGSGGSIKDTCYPCWERKLLAHEIK